MLRHTYIAGLVNTYNTTPLQYEKNTILSKGRELTTKYNNVQKEIETIQYYFPRSKKEQQLRFTFHEVIILCSPTNRYR